MAVRVVLSADIDDPGCSVCEKRRPWDATIARLEEVLARHNVTWADFRIIHGKHLRCADARRSTGMEHRQS
jgi:hypothetical protein